MEVIVLSYGLGSCEPTRLWLVRIAATHRRCGQAVRRSRSCRRLRPHASTVLLPAISHSDPTSSRSDIQRQCPDVHSDARSILAGISKDKDPLHSDVQLLRAVRGWQALKNTYTTNSKVKLRVGHKKSLWHKRGRRDATQNNHDT